MDEKKQIDIGINVNNSSIERIVNLILVANENANTQNHQESLYKLIQEEKNEIQLTSNLLEILQNFNQFINKLTSTQNLIILIYIKNILLKFKSKPKLKQIPNLEKKDMDSINFYLNFNFNNSNNTDFNKIRKIYDEIIISLFDLIVVMNDPKKFLQQIYDKIIIVYLNTHNNQFNYILSNESIIKFIFVYENFSRIYLIYIIKNEEINIIFDKYLELLKYCKNFCFNSSNGTPNDNNKQQIEELNAKIINQCILSFSKTTMLSLDNFIKSELFNISPEIKGFNEKSNNKNGKKYIFIRNNSFLEFFSLCFYYDNNKNFLTFGLEYSNNNDKTFDFLISKGKGILIEVLTILVKKLAKYESFNSSENFKSETFKYYCNIVEYLMNFYKIGNYPREKADNSPEEIIQLSIIVKIMNFIEEIADNSIYNNLIESNLYSINSNNKNEKYEEIFKYIIVPNLLPSDLEKTFFEIEKDEYVKNIFDMSHTCEVKLPKQKSIKLLMLFCDSIEGFLSKIVHVYILILKFISLDNNNNPTNIEIEDKYKSLFLFLTQNIIAFNLFEQCLQVLTSISFLFGDNQDVSDYFCDEIDLINYKLIKITDPYLKSKLCVFYSYNLEILFHNNEEVLSKSFDDSLNFLFDCIFNKTSNASLKKTAFNCINEIIFNNYLKKFCITSVNIHALKIVNHFNIKENLEGYEEEFNEFLKGIMKEYIYDLGDSIIQLFDLFWNKFLVNLIKLENIQQNKNYKENMFSQNLKNVLKDRTKEVNQTVELSSEINIIKNFINMVINKNIDIKNNIYEKILSLLKKLPFYIDTDFEEEILQIISKVILDVKLLPDAYYADLKEFLKALNKVLIDNNFRYNIENYHLDFIFECLQSFRRTLLSKENIKENLIINLKNRLASVRKCIPIQKIISEHYIYCDMGLCIDIFFFSNFQNSEIILLSEIFYRRMEKIPNTDYDLNVKLCLNIFLLFIKTENYDIFDEIFLNKKVINLYHFLCKVIQFFPVKDLSIIQQEIIAIFCSLIIRYMIIKQKNNQKILFTEDNNLNDVDIQKIYFHIISLNLNILNIIKNKSKNIMNKYEETEEKIKSENLNKEIIIDSYEINENNGKNNFKKNTKMIYKERAPHNNSILKKNNLENEDVVDYQANEDDFLINNENDDKYYDDENINPMNKKINDENSSDDYNIYDEGDLDDKDEEFLTVKNESKNNFMHYYNKFANEELVVYLRNINEFQLFEIMMKDIEINDINFYNQLLYQIKTTLGENKLELIQQFRGIQKIEFKNKNIFTYRKILKIQKNKI